MKNKGFTLVGLVATIVVIGILSAIALPQFMNLQRDAKVATVEGLAAAIVSAADLSYSKALAEGKDSAANEQLDIQRESLALIQYGYPSVNEYGMEYFLFLESSRNNVDNLRWTWESNDSTPAGTPHYWVVTSTRLLKKGPYVSGDVVRTGCYVKYNAPTDVNTSFSVEIFTDGCD